MSAPAVFMAFAVGSHAVLVVRDGSDTTLGDPQSGAARLLGEAELDQRRVALIRCGALRVVPAEGEAAVGLGLHDPDRHGHVRLPVTAAPSPLPRKRSVRAGAR